MSALGRAIGASVASEEHLRAMRAAAWHQQEIVCVRLDEVRDPVLREAFAQYAEREFGRRHAGGRHGA